MMICDMKSDVVPYVVLFLEASAMFCFYRYSVVKKANTSQLLLVATERTANVAALLGTELESVGTFMGNAHTHASLFSMCVFTQT